MRSASWVAALAALALLAGLPDPVLSARERCECEMCGNSGGPTGKVGNTAVTDPYTKAKPFPPKGDSHVRNDTSMMILLSAYRDPRCAQTTANVFLRATYPQRMHVGIVQQKQDTGDEFDCVALYCEVMKANGHPECPYLDNIQVVTVDSHKSEGPIWARGLGEPMVKPGHEFCMQVDAHVDFMHGYDTSLMKMWAMTENEYGVLSTYVGNLGRDLSKKGEVLVGHPYYQVPVICGTIKGGHGVMRNKQAFGATCLEKPLLSFTWAAGWSFAKCHFERNAPNDPQMGGMFDGEEFGRFIRSWTKGYDTYTPHRPIVFHDYNHSHKFQRGREGTWNSNPSNIKEAVARYFTMVDAPGHRDIDLKGWGIGDRRTLDQFIEFAGLDPRNSKDIDGDKRCGTLSYVPFTEDPTLLGTAMPELPYPLPGTMAEASSYRGNMPEVLPEYIEAALFMRGMLNEDAPDITHERQIAEFGEPPNQYWQSLIERAQAADRKPEPEPEVVVQEEEEDHPNAKHAADPIEEEEEEPKHNAGDIDNYGVAVEEKPRNKNNDKGRVRAHKVAHKRHKVALEFADEDTVSDGGSVGRSGTSGPWSLVHVLVVIAAFYGGLTLAKNGIVMWKNREIPKAKAYIA